MLKNCFFGSFRNEESTNLLPPVSPNNGQIDVLNESAVFAATSEENSKPG